MEIIITNQAVLDDLNNTRNLFEEAIKESERAYWDVERAKLRLEMCESRRDEMRTKLIEAEKKYAGKS